MRTWKICFLFSIMYVYFIVKYNPARFHFFLIKDNSQLHFQIFAALINIPRHVLQKGSSEYFRKNSLKNIFNWFVFSLELQFCRISIYEEKYWRKKGHLVSDTFALFWKILVSFLFWRTWNTFQGKMKYKKYFW